MFEITTETHFSAAHRLRNYKGPCENLHGHNWLVKATVKCTQLDERGIGIDFRDLKNSLKEIANGFDHKDLNSVLDPLDINPSSENIARYIFEKLQDSLKNTDVTVSRIEVYETPGNCAAYFI